MISSLMRQNALKDRHEEYPLVNDTGAHGFAMGYNYNNKPMKSARGSTQTGRLI